MANRLVVGVIGLGKFGLTFGHALMNLGHKVIGVDSSEENVRLARHVLTQVYIADATNKDVLDQLGFADLNHVLVSVGDSIAASSMIAMYLKEMGVPSVWVKAINADHEKLLYRVGVDEVVIPEFLAAKQLANRIAFPGIIENLPFDSSMALKEVEVEKWKGMSLRQVDLTNRFGIQIIAIKKGINEKYRYIPRADDLLEKGDTVVLIGEMETLMKIES